MVNTIARRELTNYIAASATRAMFTLPPDQLRVLSRYATACMEMVLDADLRLSDAQYIVHTALSANHPPYDCVLKMRRLRHHLALTISYSRKARVQSVPAYYRPPHLWEP